jgi:hypothetical protein
MSAFAKVVDYNIEYAHIYASDIKGDLSRVQRNIERTGWIIESLRQQNKTFVLSVLIDDYSENQEDVHIPDIENIFADLGLSPDHIVMESTMAGQAGSFMDLLSEKNLRREGNQIVFQSESKDIHFSELLKDRRRYKSVFMEKSKLGKSEWEEKQNKEYILLKEQRVHSNSDLLLCHTQDNITRFSCPLLAACWYLARLGVEPFASPVIQRLSKNKPFIGSSLITVLPLEFIKVEATAVDLIRLSKTKTISKCRKRIEYFFTH